jgi:predicted enzyme related to lactoylglutathione lyase
MVFVYSVDNPIGLCIVELMKENSYFCHIVIPCRNLRKSRRFYEKVFGWTVKPQPGSDSLDILPPSGKGPSAELNPNESVVTPTIYTQDIEFTLERIARHGGMILLPKTPVDEKGEYGHYALFEDPQGSKFCLYSEG